MSSVVAIALEDGHSVCSNLSWGNSHRGGGACPTYWSYNHPLKVLSLFIFLFQPLDFKLAASPRLACQAHLWSPGHGPG